MPRVSPGSYPLGRMARRVILGGGLYLNDQRVTDPKRELSTDDLLQGRFLTLRKGRRNLAFLVFNR